MPLGISTLCTIGRTYKEMVRLLDLGIDVLEILEEYKDRLSPARIRKVEEITASYDVRLTVHSPILDMNIASATRGFREESVRQVLRSVDNAALLGAELVVVHPGVNTPLDFLVPKVHWAFNRESLRKIIAYAEAKGVEIGVENMPAGHPFLLRDSSEFLALIAEGLPLRMTLDVGHANTTSQLEKFVRDMRRNIAHVHLHDNRGGRDEHLVIGKGTIDWAFLKENLDMGSLTGVVEANTLSDALQSYSKARQIFSS